MGFNGSISARLLYASVSAGAIAICSSPAVAQQTARSPQTVELPPDIIVTGEKKETSLQHAPLAITALTSQSLAASNIHQLSDLNTEVPGLTIAKNGGYTRVMTIRGIGFETSDNISSQPGTSFHIDGVYISGAYSLGMDLIDIDRLEVLRGPQSTVFGQSAEGGVINAISRKPKLDAFGGTADVSVGNYDLYHVNGTLNVPLTSTLAIRVVGDRYYHQGFARETDLSDYRLDDADRYTIKGQLLWQPTDTFSLLLSGQHLRAHEHGAAQKNIDDPDPDPRELTQDFPNKYDMSFTLVSATAQLELPWANLKSVTGYQHMRNPNQVDNDRLDLASAGFYDNLKDWTNIVSAFSQEIDISSKPGSHIQWIVGGYYLYEKKTWHVDEFVGTDANPTFNIPPNLPTDWPYNLDYTLDTTLRHNSYALFGQATLPIGNRLRLTAGGRYTIEHMANYTDTDHGLYSPAIYQYPRFHPLTGKANLEFDVTSRNLVYASISRGYKPGGVNYNSTPYYVGLTYKPESMVAYEIGLKNRLFGNRATLNMAAFFYDYKNLQYQQEDPIPYQGGVSNIPRAHIYGFEAEGSIELVHNLRLNANGTYLGGKLLDNYYALDPSAAHEATLAAAALGYGPFDAYTIDLRAQQVRNTKGNKPPKLPNFQGGANLAYTIDMPNGDSILLRGEYDYRGEFVYRIFNDSVRDKVPSYSLVNLYGSYSFRNHWKLSLNVSNLFNKAGVNSRYSNPFGRFTTSQEYIPPRQVIGTVSYAF